MLLSTAGISVDAHDGRPQVLRRIQLVGRRTRCDSTSCEHDKGKTSSKQSEVAEHLMRNKQEAESSEGSSLRHLPKSFLGTKGAVLCQTGNLALGLLKNGSLYDV